MTFTLHWIVIDLLDFLNAYIVSIFLDDLNICTTHDTNTNCVLDKQSFTFKNLTVLIDLTLMFYSAINRAKEEEEKQEISRQSKQAIYGTGLRE